jgi:hypothetical protein
MISISKVWVRSLDVDYLDVYWEIEDTGEDAWDYTFTVERSESPMGPFDQVSEAFSDKYAYRDVIVNLFNKWRKFYYRIKIIKKDDSTTEYSEVATQEAKPDLNAQEIRRLEMLAFREHIGRKVWLFPRRTFGQRCPDCYDSRGAARRKGACPTCFATTYVRGYLDPIVTYLQIDPSPKHNELIQVGVTQQQNTTGRLPYFPPIRPKDILVEVENRRWRVERVSMTERLRAVVHHEVVLHEIPTGDVEYTIPVNLDDLRLYEPSPQREFTNPHTLESVEGAEWVSSLLKGSGYL